MEQFDEQEIIQFPLATGEDLSTDRFSQLSTLSSAFLYNFVPVSKQPEPPEVIFVPTDRSSRLETLGIMASWNFLWEAALRLRLSKTRRYLHADLRYALPGSRRTAPEYTDVRKGEISSTFLDLNVELPVSELDFDVLVSLHSHNLLVQIRPAE